MPVAVNIPVHMRRHTDELKSVNVEGSTVSECMLDLVRRYPGLHQDLFESDGRFITHSAIWVNRKSVPPESQWHHAVCNNDEIDILYLYAGG